METLDLFVRLFRGRGDARGSWGGPAIREPVTPEHFAAHLSSPAEGDWFGSYNVIGTFCSWGCVDIDFDDLTLAQNIRHALGAKGITAWVEQTTRGYHVWVFPLDQLVEATVMRSALTAACMAVGYSPREVFPKQTKVSAGGLGNFVRLPYNGYWSDGEHVPRMFTDHLSYLHDFPGDPLRPLLEHMDATRASTPALTELAELLPVPQPTSQAVDMQGGVYEDEVMPELRGLAYVIWRDGPLPGSDRSTILVHLARLLAEDDVPPQTAFAILASADRRWGKSFLDRGATGEQIMQRIIDKAYA